jgi:hypothetical protein
MKKFMDPNASRLEPITLDAFLSPTSLMFPSQLEHIALSFRAQTPSCIFLIASETQQTATSIHNHQEAGRVPPQ